MSCKIGKIHFYQLLTRSTLITSVLSVDKQFLSHQILIKHSTCLINSPDFSRRRLSSLAKMAEPKVTPIKVCSDVKSADYDGVVVVGPSIKNLPVDVLRSPLQAFAEVDKTAEHGVFIVPGQGDVKRIVFSGTGPLDKDYDDVRR